MQGRASTNQSRAADGYGAKKTPAGRTLCTVHTHVRSTSAIREDKPPEFLITDGF